MAASAAYIPGASLSDKLRLAASKGQVDKVNELINAGATFKPDREGRTALHYAALNGQSEIVQILADEGADINTQDTLGYTALHRATAQGHLEVIKVLLVEGCVVDRQDDVHGNSPLHEASWNGYSKTLELLIRHKANVHCVNKAGFTALHLAAQNGHNQSARVLLYAGCNADLRNNYGDSALHTASRYGHAGVTRILISARANINEQNKNGDTALHISAALKRRKLTKLLVESGCNINLRNKQNETAVDVARRKDHPEVILLITSSQPKNGKKNKKKDKGKKEKGSKLVLNGAEETTEKKGLFFRKKKSKDKDEKKKLVEVSRVPEYHPKAPSEASSSEFSSQMPPGELLRGFQHHQSARYGNHGHPREPRHHSNQRESSTRGTTTKDGKSKIKGLLSEYAPRNGVQYYKDLAGNVRQGPIGYAPVCNCEPVIKKMAKRMESDRNNLYDHIDSSHKTLAGRIETLDKRTAQQVHSLDKRTEERMERDRGDREEFVRSCIRKEKMEASDDCEQRHDQMKVKLQDHMDHRFTNFERYYVTTRTTRQQPRYQGVGYHDDDMLNQHNMVFDPEEPPMPGRLFRSRSDETLSVASSHHSRRHWKLRTNPNRDVLDMKLARVTDKARRIERKLRSKSAGLNSRAPSEEQINRPRDSSVPTYRQRMPEGNSGSDLHSEYKTYKDYVEKQHQWAAKRNPIDAGLTQQFEPPKEVGHYGSLRHGTTQKVTADIHHQARSRSASSSAGHTAHTQCQNGQIQGQNGHMPAPTGHTQDQSGHNTHMWTHNTQVPVQHRQQQDRSTNHNGHIPPQNVQFQTGHPQQYSGSSQNLYGTETPRCRTTSENHRARPSSISRAGDGAATHVETVMPSHPQHPPSQHDVQQGYGQHPAKGVQPSSSYDNSQHRYAQHVAHPTQHPPPSTPTTTPPSTSWHPLHTSSPDSPALSPAHSVLNNTPLYPSPNYPKVSQSESGSNPDSGYGCRLLGGRQVSGTTVASNSSSFQSHGHNSSSSTNRSSLNGDCPMMHFNQEPMVRRPQTTGQMQQPNTQQIQHNMPANRSRWYEPKLVDNNNKKWPSVSETYQVQSQTTSQGQSAIIGKATQV